MSSLANKILFCFALFTTLLGFPGNSPALILSFHPSDLTPVKNTSFEADVVISGIAECYSASFDSRVEDDP